MRTSWLAVTASLCLIMSAFAQAPAASLSQIIGNRVILGKDIAVALRSLPAWNSQGEHEVWVFSHQIVGATRFETREEAQKNATQLNALLLKLQVHLKTEFSENAQTTATLRAEGVSFPEDDSYRVVLAETSLQFLNSEITLPTLRQAIGEPQNTTYLTLQNKTERRPIQLAIYQYADGQVAFAVPNLSLHPGTIDRMLLNVRSVSAAVFQEAK